MGNSRRRESQYLTSASQQAGCAKGMRARNENDWGSLRRKAMVERHTVIQLEKQCLNESQKLLVGKQRGEVRVAKERQGEIL